MILGVWGASRRSLEAIFEEGTKKDIKNGLDFEQGTSVLGSHFVFFWTHNLYVFVDALPDRVSRDFGAPKPAKKEPLGCYFGCFFRDPRFHVFYDSTMKNTHFGRPEGSKIGAFWRSLSGVGFGRPPGRDFSRCWPILGSLGEPILTTFE